MRRPVLTCAAHKDEVQSAFALGISVSFGGTVRLRETAMQTESEGALVKALGVRSLTASIVNTTIGAGIFVLPAAVAAGLGAAAPLAYVLCAALLALIVSCFGAAGSRVSLTGGLYAYVGVAFGPFIGFLAGVLYQLMAAFAVASVCRAFAGSVAAVWGPAATPAES